MTNRVLHPHCYTCGWRKGGVDSWASDRCKCGHWEPPIVKDRTMHPSAIDQPATLRCRKCRVTYERPFEQWFHRDLNGPSGWRKWCKACYSEAPSIRARNERR